jgi:endonuclease YncB( thermonuclease family)
MGPEWDYGRAITLRQSDTVLQCGTTPPGGSSQLCRGEDSLPYRCGAKAANEPAAFISSRPVSCTPVTVDRYGRTVASCAVAGIDLADWLRAPVLGWGIGRATATVDIPRRRTKASRSEHGMWAGSFVEPWRFRECVRLGGRPAQCSDEAQ